MYGALVTARGNTLNMVPLSSGAQSEHFFFSFFLLKKRQMKFLTLLKFSFSYSESTLFALNTYIDMY